MEYIHMSITSYLLLAFCHLKPSILRVDDKIASNKATISFVLLPSVIIQNRTREPDSCL